MNAPDRASITAEIARGLTVFHPPGDVFEIRIPKTARKTVAGYFADVQQAAVAIVTAAEQFRCSIYHTLNPIPPDLLARAANRLVPFCDTTTKDADVLRRRWLPIDCDPRRPVGISATEAEHAAALARRDVIVEWLTGEHRWPAPLRADSGNGAHAVYAIDLPNDPEALDLVARVLTALAARFDDPRVAVDPVLANAARILKVYGTVSRKGDHTRDRPHRRAQLTGVPTPLVPVPLDALRAVADLAPRAASTRVKGAQTRSPSEPVRPADVPLLAAFEARDWNRSEAGEGKHYVRCPWADAHSGDSGASEAMSPTPKRREEVARPDRRRGRRISLFSPNLTPLPFLRKSARFRHRNGGEEQCASQRATHRGKSAGNRRSLFLLRHKR